MKFWWILLVPLFTACVANRNVVTTHERVRVERPDGQMKKGRALGFTSYLNCSSQEAWNVLSDPATVLDLMSPQAILKPRKRQATPHEWELDVVYDFKLTMNGFIPFGIHQLYYESLDSLQMILQTREHGLAVPVWDQYLSITLINDSTCMVREELVVAAGWINWYVAAYGKDLFKGKHKRLQKYFEKN